jgi:hypothetical protein
MLLTEDKPTSISFDLSIDGTKSVPSSVRLVMGSNPGIVYEASKEDGKWSCSFTPPKSLGSSFPILIEVVVNGSVFVPYKSTASFKPLETVSVSNVTEANKFADLRDRTFTAEQQTRVKARTTELLKTLEPKPVQPKKSTPKSTQVKLQLPESKVKLGAGLNESTSSTTVGIKFTKGPVVYK